jgi:hypothetical protein
MRRIALLFEGLYLAGHVIRKPLLQVRRVRSRHLHRMTNVGGIHDVTCRCFLPQKRHRLLRASRFRPVMEEPTSRRPEAEGEQDRRSNQPRQARRAACTSIKARIGLWNGILELIERGRQPTQQIA